MRLLLDTHVFIWLDIAHHRLSNTAQEVIRNPENTLHLSLVSVWEMQIKMQLGKLHLNNPLPGTLAAQQRINGIRLLPIQLGHILALSILPSLHHDPFDRLLVAQAQVEDLTLITNDPKMRQYGVVCLW